MRTRLGIGLATALSCAALVTVVGVARDGDGSAAASLSGPPRGPYVALGDSYTAGPDIPGRRAKPAGCDRSDRNYPALVAAELGLERAEFRDMSCSGATTGDLFKAQDTDSGTNPAQLSAVSAGTRLVTVGIGGNDIGFGELITGCVKAGVRYRLESRIGDLAPDRAPCRAQHTSGDTDEIGTRIAATGGRVADVLADIRRRAPEARIYLVGYPTILPARGADCGRAMGLAPGDVTFLRQKEQQLNAMLRSTAADAGAGYVDTYAPSDGRDACAEADVRWVEPLIPAAPAAPVHPNERGERGMAQAVLRAFRAGG
ncbi:SGNH/GDSL hydrolase family protein [Streptomyces justiciae]|uniref:SGNH/GDSL hydrolase family protein n=1 Tax=Streptomyces justiciae TaxID=2780140 RepID=UPI00187E0789|nr:SGNH/GDSL hydrolase family protein [Streptomyces justiciae]MBE8471873.1 SGNH/GDSL hydrolase family protein [Streptomyces justiciae]